MRISDWSSDVCSSDLLGTDVRVSAERGAREFAGGDRIMFLKNERGLGVKNGTLGQVERVSPDSMAVRLDDGRRIAFDLKDYAHIDHGYAATIHKSQGVTVDQAHVLATPGMDRHSAYVALSRSEEHTSELQSLMRISYAVFCLKKKKQQRSVIFESSTIEHNS